MITRKDILLEGRMRQKVSQRMHQDVDSTTDTSEFSFSHRDLSGTNINPSDPLLGKTSARKRKAEGLFVWNRAQIVHLDVGFFVSLEINLFINPKHIMYVSPGSVNIGGGLTAIFTPTAHNSLPFGSSGIR